MIQCDIFGIEEFTIKNKKIQKDQYLGPIMEIMINNHGLKVKQYTVRLINAMASDSVGRSYLIQNDNMIFLLNTILKGEKTETLLRQDALGALQKFSLRRKPQDIMIELFLIDELVSLIDKEK